MIKRDQYGIICQHDPNDPPYMDGGDSARATGMMAMTGSAQDLRLLPQFEYLRTGLLRRHPMQPYYSDTNNFTRDQLVQFTAGINKLSDKTLAKRVFWSHAKRLFFCQNTHHIDGVKKPWYKGRDPLPLSNIGQMIIAAKIYWLYWLLPICAVWLLLDILFSSVFQDAKDENNQVIALCDVYGKYALKLYCSLDRRWEDKLIEYWGVTSGTFRYQPEIGDQLITYIKIKLINKYIYRS